MPQSINKNVRVNVRTPEIMELVQSEVARHYQSSIVEKIRARGGVLTIGNTTVRLAEQFGFCYGVERAIDLAYASRRVFPDRRIFLIGEIIHNPAVNQQLTAMNIVSLPWQEVTAEYESLQPDDVVIVPAFGAPLHFMEKLRERGCQVVDTTCGDVMKVWRRVKTYAREGITSIIHGKSDHEETRATASRAMGDDGAGHFLVILTLEQTDFVCDYIKNGGDRAAFLERFSKNTSQGFDPDCHLLKVGVANQTTMLKSETEEIQRRIADAVLHRDGNLENFRMFDTICGATQERQDALFDLLKKPADFLIVVGGYNSSNTSHLVEIGEKNLPTFFVRGSECLDSLEEIVHFDLARKQEVKSAYPERFFSKEELCVGITAGASCPNNLIESTVLKVFELRGVAREEVERVG